MKIEHNIKNNKISKDIKLCYISDIHSDINKLKSILEDVTKSKVSALLIGGDLLNSIEDYTEKNIIKDLLIEASKKIDIYIGLGNHELVYYDKTKELKENDTKYWKELNKIKRINVLEYPNKKATFTRWSLNKDIDVSALNLPIEYYWNGENKEELIKYFKVLDKVNPKKYNILLLHSPINLIEKKRILKELKEYDLILTGHMHSGLVPKIFRKKFGKGLVGPYKNFFPKYSYGKVKDDNTTILISGGVSKFSDTSGMPFIRNKHFKDFLYKIYPPEIEIINFTK